MDHKEKKLSDYIDCLNTEKKPKAHENPEDSSELNKLFHTVRLVKSLREPAMPRPGYSKQLAQSVESQLSSKNPTKSRKKVWFTGVAGIAVILAIVFMVNFILPFSKTNIVYAMEEAFREVETYHGFLEVVQINADGQSVTQSKTEVWADKEGRYYLKGLEGPLKGSVTVNNGKQKWQLRFDQNEVHLFPAFPDAYRFIFELGNEIEKVKNALSTKIVGKDTIAGRQTSIIEVTPDGGVPYQVWIDEETNLPLQKQYAMHNALQYRTTYTQIEFKHTIPLELTTYHVPDGFKEINTNPEQFISDMGEAQEIIGFTSKAFENTPSGYALNSIAVVPDTKLLKLYYTTSDKKQIVVIQGKSFDEFKPAPNAILGKFNNSVAEIQSPIQENLGVLGDSGVDGAVTDINSIRWQENGFEYAVVGNPSLKDQISFIKNLTGNEIEMSSPGKQDTSKPKVEVPIDLTMEENTQKSVDGGSSPWKLDPVFVAQVFVSLEISPEGIIGEYPITTEELKVTQNTGTEAIVEVNTDKTPISRVYLKRLIRQDSTGIWTVIGYDPIE